MNTSPAPAAARTARDYDVRAVDLADDDALAGWHRIYDAADRFERPWAMLWSLPELTVDVRTQDEGAAWYLFSAFDGERMVGAGLCIVPLLDNRDKLYAGVYVAPEDRRKGVGGALVEHLVAKTRELGRSQVLVDSGIPATGRESHPYVRFANRHGFAMASVEVHRQLDLPLPAAEIEAMQAGAAPHHAGYSLRTYVDVLPDEVLESYCSLVNQLAVDAPTGDVEYEEEAHSPALHRKHEARMRQQGRSQITTLALTADGEAVAVTDLVVPAEDRPKVHQWATLVRRDHRGHRLGAAVKLQNLLTLQERFPERTEIHTTNEETNDSMVHINERLGFRIVEICPEFLLRLA